MICSFNGQDSQPIQPMLLRWVLIRFNLEKNHLAVALSYVMSETIAGQCTEGGCYGVNFELFTLPIPQPESVQLGGLPWEMTPMTGFYQQVEKLLRSV